MLIVCWVILGKKGIRKRYTWHCMCVTLYGISLVNILKSFLYQCNIWENLSAFFGDSKLCFYALFLYFILSWTDLIIIILLYILKLVMILLFCIYFLIFACQKYGMHYVPIDSFDIFSNFFLSHFRFSFYLYLLLCHEGPKSLLGN